MSQTANENSELPPGHRSNLACAVHADNPDSLAAHLEACSKIERNVLLTVEGGKVPAVGAWDPWTSEQIKQSPIKGIDNRLFIQLRRSTEGTIYTLAFFVAACFGSVHCVSMLLSDKYRNDVDPAFLNHCAVRMASMKGHAGVMQLLLGDKRVDSSVDSNQPLVWACYFKHVDVMKLLLNDERVDPSMNKKVMKAALEWTNINTLRRLLADTRIVFTNELLSMVDRYNSSDRVNALFTAAHPRIWPRVIRNDLECVSRNNGHLRNKLDGLELKSSWTLLLCVKQIFTPTVAARVGDVLREVCSEWTYFRSQEILL